MGDWKAVQKSVVANTVCAFLKAEIRVLGSFRSADTSEIPFEAQCWEVGEDGERVRPRMVYWGRVRKWVAIEEPWRWLDSC